jgi:hypothetical protein
MKLAEFKNEMVELMFNENSETTRGYVSLVDYPEMYPQARGGFGGGSDGIDFVRLDDETISYRINTESSTGDWGLKNGLNDEENFDEFISDLVSALNQE